MHIEFNSSSARGNSGCSSAAGKIIMSLFFGIFLFMGLATTFLMASGFVEEFKASRWIPTSCKIISSSVETGSGDEPYRAIVRYNYNINGQSFLSDRLYYSENSTSDYNDAQAVVLRYSAGAPASCLVNPDNHSEAILEAGSYLAYFGIFFPVIFVLVGAGGLYFVWFFKGASLSGPAARSISKRARGNHGRTVALIVGGAFMVFGGVFSLFFVSPSLQLLDAHNWIETECTIISADVQSHRGDDSTTYSIEILFEYHWGDTTLRSDQYDFADWSSSGYDSKQEVVDSYPAGSRALCFVNPDKPFIAVLDRDFQLKYLIGLFPLVFVVAGLALVIFTTKKSASIARPRGLPTSQAPGTASVSEAPEMTGPMVLEPSVSPVGKLFGIIFGCLFWNGIVSIFLWQLISDWQTSGSISWFSALFLTPFVLVGLGLIGGIFYFFLALFNPRPTLKLSKSTIRLGDTVTVHWRFAGRAARIDVLTITLEGSESATYRRGTDTHTDTSVFFRTEVANLRQNLEIARGNRQLVFPGDTMHTFESNNNKIIWKIKVHGDIRRWPDVSEEFVITVDPIALRDIEGC